MEPDPGGSETPPDTSPQGPPGTSLDRKKWAVIGSIVVIAVVVAVASLPGLLVQPPQGEVLPVASPPPATSIVPPDHWTPGVPVPPSPVASPSATATQTPGGPPGFTVTVSPAETSAARGETVTYTMTIDAQNGFSEDVSMQLAAGFLFFSETYDLGTQVPPYPKTITYPFKVPDTLPPGVTVNGVLTSTGGGITRENQITLHVQ
jgi:hypothetical protein